MTGRVSNAGFRLFPRRPVPAPRIRFVSPKSQSRSHWMRRMPQLYAITTVYNPAGYESRFRLYREFAKRLEKSGVVQQAVAARSDFRLFSLARRGCDGAR